MERTRQTQYIEQVAGIMVGWWEGPDPERAREINDGDGWTVDVRLIGEEYVSDTDWTRVSNLHLSPHALVRALDLAERWLARDFVGAEAV